MSENHSGSRWEPAPGDDQQVRRTGSPNDNGTGTGTRTGTGTAGPST